MMAKVNQTELVVFTSFDWKEAQKAYDGWIKDHLSVEPGSVRIAVYFNDDEDLYKVTKIAAGQSVERNVYSWDDVSQLIHDHL